RHPIPLTDRLYRNDLRITADGGRTLRFTDVTAESGLEARGYGMGVATGDFDNDGWVDLYVTNLGSNQLWRNLGNGKFADVTGTSATDDQRWTVPAVFVDYDLDGWLDLFVGNYIAFSPDIPKICRGVTGAPDYCGPSAYPPHPDRLFRNRGDGTFEDVTYRVGIRQGFGGALGVVTADLNGDGWPDIYVANDQLPNQMWLSRGDGTFSDEAFIGGSAVNSEGRPAASMGVDAGDFDGDGDFDPFMTHLTGETNTIYLNDGRGMFDDNTVYAGLGVPSRMATAFGTGWFDFDNDGWLDLFTANGAVKAIESLARENDPYPHHQPNQLYRNLGRRRCEEVTARAGEVF
ncbi:MAG: VCBS repeat-containing protein, partial [bacterium]|nr:VCBS repeat-containing protein [bacterium]